MKRVREIGADRLVPSVSERVSLMALRVSCCVQTTETVARAEPNINSGSRTAQVSARGPRDAHVSTSPVVAATTKRVSDVDMTSSQVRQESDRVVVNGDHY